MSAYEQMSIRINENSWDNTLLGTSVLRYYGTMALPSNLVYKQAITLMDDTDAQSTLPFLHPNVASIFSPLFDGRN